MPDFLRLHIQPRLLNSASPWASSLKDLKELYACPSTGAVTTRTATLSGFAENHTHQVAFLEGTLSSINSYGYSPFPLAQYLEWVHEILAECSTSRKPFIISITVPVQNTLADSPNTADAPEGELASMISLIQKLRQVLSDDKSASSRIAIEINTSCPNIQGHPPPSYDPPSLRPILQAVSEAVLKDPSLVVGLKLPPYVFSRQFTDMIDLLASFTKALDGILRNPISFLTCTNTLGSSLIFQGQSQVGSCSSSDFIHMADFSKETISGGLAGEYIHPLALGNVQAFNKLLAGHDDPAMRSIAIIGVGGVASPAAAERMIQAGATAVGCATALGVKGLPIFDEILKASSLSN